MSTEYSEFCNSCFAFEYAGYYLFYQYLPTFVTINDKKCINKEERVQHLPGYCPQTSQETKDAEER